MNRLSTISLVSLLLAASVLASPVQFNGGRAVSDLALRPTSGAEMPLVPLASNGTTLFTAWVELRGGDSAVFGTRLSPDGTVLNPTGLRLIGTNASYGQAGVVWNDRQFVVFGPESSGVAVAVVRDDGSVTATAHIAEAGVYTVSNAVGNGSFYALIVREHTAGPVVAKLLIVGPDFKVLKVRPLNDTTSATAGVSLASDGTNFLLVWENWSATSDVVFAQQFNSSGQPIGGQQTVPTGAASGNYLGNFWPAASWSGSGYTIVWMSSGIAGITLSTHGTLGAPFRVTNEEASFPSIAWNGREHLVTWTYVTYAPDGQFHLDGARISSTGQVLGSTTLSVSSLGWAEAALAGNATGFVGIWLGQVFGGKGHSALTSRYVDQKKPMLAAGGANVLAVWSEDGDLYAGRLGRGGAPLDGSGIRVAAASAEEVLVPLTLVSNGSIYLFAWSNAVNEIRIARIGEDGAILDPAGGTLLARPTTVVSSLVGASDGSNFMLAWWDGKNLVSMPVASFGPVSGEAQAIAPPKSTPTPIAILWNGKSYSLVWQQPLETTICGPRPNDCFPAIEQRLSLLDRNGSVLGMRVMGENLGIQTVVRTDDGLLPVLGSNATYTQQFTFAGDPISKPVRVLDWVPAAVIAPTNDGFALAYRSSDHEIGAVLLDGHGKPLSAPASVIVTTGIELANAVFANDATWVAYTAPAMPPGLAQPIRRALTGELRINATAGLLARRRP